MIKLSSDYSGHENLENVSQMCRFNRLMYEEILLPVLKGDYILEVGSGIGTFSEKIIRGQPHSHIILTDVSLSYIKQLEERFYNNNNNNNDNISICKLDLNCKADYDKIGYEKFDCIIAINVLEHVKKDEFVLQQLYKMLKKEGILVLLVPCHKFLYNVIDKNLGHFRRYTKEELKSKVKKSQFTIDSMFYFNTLGIIGWYINGSLAKNPKINPTASKIFDKIIPLLMHGERIIGKRITGLSIVCYLKKQS
jgi:2-polyprenyl-3-methyl-5-hydroxy-6-metoxy-1,4-benzoquinol methylase